MRRNVFAALGIFALAISARAVLQVTLPNVSGSPVSGTPSMHIFGLAIG